MLSEIENLVFEGGGIKGVAFAKVPLVLNKFGILANIKKVAGSSAGSIIALLIALRYSDNAIYKLLVGLKFKDMQDSKLLITRLYMLMFHDGLHSGDNFVRWLKRVIKFKMGYEDATFLDLYNHKGIELVVTGTEIGSGTTYFSYKKYPSMPLWKAIRISISIPIFFTPVQYGNKQYVDGGILNNYPIWVFDDPDDYKSTYSSGNIDNNKTLGFKLITRSSLKTTTLELPNYIPSLFSLLYNINETMLDCIDENYKSGDYWLRTVEIDTYGIKSTEFSLSDENYSLLIKEGENTTARVLITRKKVEELDSMDLENTDEEKLQKIVFEALNETAKFNKDKRQPRSI